MRNCLSISWVSVICAIYRFMCGSAKRSRTIYGKPQNSRHLASSTQRRRSYYRPQSRWYVNFLSTCAIFSAALALLAVQHIVLLLICVVGRSFGPSALDSWAPGIYTYNNIHLGMQLFYALRANVRTGVTHRNVACWTRTRPTSLRVL